jgi:Domain of unknown function (DUF6484)
MNRADDPFLPLADVAQTAASDDFALLMQQPVGGVLMAPGLATAAAPRALMFNPLAPAVARLHGFDLLERPLVSNVSACPGEVIAARSTVALRHEMISQDVLLMFADGDVRQPVIVGVIEPRPLHAELPARLAIASEPVAQVDGERQLIQAEREVVLRCGDASITLTRAGKVIIKGHYILSRSTGYNKIKGAAIDIN